MLGELYIDGLVFLMSPWENQSFKYSIYYTQSYKSPWKIFSQLYGLRIFSFLYHHSSRSPYSFLEKMQELSNRSPHFWSLASHICPTYAYKVNFLDPQSPVTVPEEISIYCKINMSRRWIWHQLTFTNTPNFSFFYWKIVLLW